MVKKLRKSPTFSYQLMLFMNDVPSLIFHRLDNDTSDNEMKHKQHLRNVLDAWGMQKICIAGDGNFCFNAVAFSIITNLKSIIIIINGIWSHYSS